uniref:Uncharacterized protein n=2 Tax=Avena sativa TaxID=4498 RepID=A0ACD5Y043_AVESA
MDEKKNVNNLFNRASPMRLVRVCKGMTKPQRDLITNSEFGDFLNVRCSKLIPELCRFLMDCFNPDRCELDFGPRGRVPITIQSVHRIMGVPMGSIPVAYQMDSQSTRVIMEMFRIPNGRQPSITSVETQLGPTYPANNDYLRKFTIFSVSTVFAPTTCTRVSPKCYPPVINTEAIKRLNWAKFIIDILIQTSKAKGVKNWFKTCIPYLMVLYVDSLETDAIDVPKKGTRICIWTNKMINQIVTLDTHIDGSFGKLALKKYFKKFSMFSSDPSIVDMFIKRHVPVILSEESMEKYRVSVIDMCTVFEDGLAKFLMSVGSAPNYGQEEGDQDKKKTIHKRKKRKTLADVQAAHVLKQASQQTTVGQDDALAATLRQNNTDAVDKRMVVGDKPTMENVGESHQDVEMVEQNQEVTVMVENPASVLPAENACNTTDLPVADESGMKVFSEVSDTQRCVEPEQTTCHYYTPVRASAVDPLKHLQCYGSGSQSSAESAGRGAPMYDMTPAASRTDVLIDQPGSNMGGPVYDMTPVASTASQSDVLMDQPGVDKGAPVLDITPATSAASRSDFLMDQPGAQKGAPVYDTTPPACLLRKVTGQEDQPGDGKRHVSFASQDKDSLDQFNNTEIKAASVNRVTNKTVQGSPTGRRPVTRSMSPAKLPAPIEKENPLGICGKHLNISPVPQRKSRFATSKVRASWTASSVQPVDTQGAIGKPTNTTQVNNMNRKIELDSESAEAKIETLEQRQRRELIEDCPSFDLGFDGTTQEETIHVVKEEEKQGTVEEHVIISSNDDSDSVRPGAWLSNTVCEIALHVLSKEMAAHKKHVMPLFMATKLRSATCVHDKNVKKAFVFSPEKRLDHKEQVMFPVLQNLTPELKYFTRHYYLIVLNLKAKRFEIIDSLRAEGNQGLMKDARLIIGSIKYMWSKNYTESKINIQNYKTVHIPTPMKSTTFDCGFFMLKFIEYWTGRKILTFNPIDMPIIRKIFTLKWLEWEENQTEWVEKLL